MSAPVAARAAAPADAALHDERAERAVLAAGLLDAEAALRAIERMGFIVGASDFHDHKHAVIWECMVAVHDRGEPVDIVTLAAELRARNQLNAVGGPQYLGELTDEIPTLAHCEAHAKVVADLAARRRALAGAEAFTARLRRGEPLEAAEADFTAALHRRQATEGAGRVGLDLPALVELHQRRARGSEAPIATPWPAFNTAVAGGLWPGMYVLVGGTGAGKTQWAVQIAVEAARAGGRVLYLALELGRADLAARVVGALAGVPWSGLLLGRVADVYTPRMTQAMKVAAELPFHTECGVPFGYGAETLMQRAWSLRPALVVLDYLQLCGGKAGDDPRGTVGRVSYVARTIARDLGAVVLVLSSTARANYADLVNDPSKDPGDLVGMGKESGEIEYAADGVLVLARSGDEGRGRTVVLAKNRHGPLGRVDLAWNGTAFAAAEDA